MLFSTLSALTLITSTAATISGVSFPYVNQQAWINDMLTLHNNYRALHGAPPVTWNQDLANAALTNAQQYTWAHTANNPYGENIATGTYTDPDYYGFLWYDEQKLYNYNNPGYSDATGHFTQLVWASTTQIGCAMVNQVNNQGYPYSMTCEYAPPGNIVNAGYFAANVKPLVSTSAGSVGRASLSLAAVAALSAAVGLANLL